MKQAGTAYLMLTNDTPFPAPSRRGAYPAWLSLTRHRRVCAPHAAFYNIISA